MLYVFERGKYPNHEDLAMLNLPDDDVAIAHANKIGADYVWDAPGDRNPSTVWTRRHELGPREYDLTKTVNDLAARVAELERVIRAYHDVPCSRTEKAMFAALKTGKCVIDHVSSRTCERGTKCCIEHHKDET